MFVIKGKNGETVCVKLTASYKYWMTIYSKGNNELRLYRNRNRIETL